MPSVVKKIVVKYLNGKHAYSAWSINHFVVPGRGVFWRNTGRSGSPPDVMVRLPLRRRSRTSMLPSLRCQAFKVGCRRNKYRTTIYRCGKCKRDAVSGFRHKERKRARSDSWSDNALATCAAAIRKRELDRRKSALSKILESTSGSTSSSGEIACMMKHFDESDYKAKKNRFSYSWR